MGEFKEKISKLSNSEMEEIWKKITSYQGSYIDDFLSELKDRNCLDDYISKLKDNKLIDLLVKVDSVSNSENIEIIKTYIEIRGLSQEYFNEKNSKIQKQNEKPTSEVNYRRFIWLGLLILIALVRFKACDFSNDKNQNEQYNQPSSEIRTPSLDTLKSSEPKELDFETFKNNSVEELFVPESELRQRLKFYKSMLEKNKSEQGENKEIKDFLKGQAKKDITLMLKKFNAEMIKTRNLNQIEVDQIKQAITDRYLSELNLILMSN